MLEAISSTAIAAGQAVARTAETQLVARRAGAVPSAERSASTPC